ncbi:hypothetical protein DJ018_09780 [Phenylobacterium deserti]|uniref:Uncharacterized protein n=2 Tax=Phenylobacterium deserti TaxID=1914756 RepID=A0A328AGC5_9CAUL|nr:hypothetical protein DJ018_09780 [Phenylobacterium deserti]
MHRQGIEPAPLGVLSQGCAKLVQGQPATGDKDRNMNQTGQTGGGPLLEAINDPIDPTVMQLQDQTDPDSDGTDGEEGDGTDGTDGDSDGTDGAEGDGAEGDGTDGSDADGTDGAA